MILTHTHTRTDVHKSAQRERGGVVSEWEVGRER